MDDDSDYFISHLQEHYTPIVYRVYFLVKWQVDQHPIVCYTIHWSKCLKRY